MSILLNKNTKIVVQGITGKEGAFHAEKCLEYGSNIVAGVTPGKGGEKCLNNRIPVFNSCLEAVAVTKAEASLIFVPPLYAADAIIEAADSGIKLIVCISEGIPIQDMVKAYAFVKERNCTLIGPNCPGLLTPGEAKMGIMPGFIAKKGNVGVISKSGTLTYEAVKQLCDVGLGQSTCIGIGGDPIIGTSMIDLLKLFEDDPETKAMVMIGEIGGAMEIEAAHYIKDNIRKPVVAFIAGQTAPSGRVMGHAGAIVSGSDESASAKKEILRSCGVTTVDSPADIGKTLKEVLS